MLRSIYDDAETLKIPKERVRELLSEWKKEHFRMPADLRSLIEGVCE